VNLRRHGKAPFAVVVVHGGPGAAGEMASVARELASGWGVLEPLQTATSVNGQIEELQTLLQKKADLPVFLIGFSWGAWLSFIFAASYPAFVKKLILIGSGPFEEKYAARIQETRLNRLSEEERREVESLVEILNNPMAEDKSEAFARFGALFSKADAYDPIEHESEAVDYQPDIFQSVWTEAAELRRSGKLLKLAKQIKCPGGWNSRRLRSTSGRRSKEVALCYVEEFSIYPAYELRAQALDRTTDKGQILQDS